MDYATYDVLYDLVAILNDNKAIDNKQRSRLIKQLNDAKVEK